MSQFHKNRAVAETAAEQLKIYAQPQRLMILSCLLEGEFTVSEIDAATGIGQPALSQQLAELRRKELVRTRRQGTQIFYTLADERIELCVKCLEAMLSNEAPTAQRLQAAIQPKPSGTQPPVPAGTARFAQIIQS